MEPCNKDGELGVVGVISPSSSVWPMLNPGELTPEDDERLRRMYGLGAFEESGGGEVGVEGTDSGSGTRNSSSWTDLGGGRSTIASSSYVEKLMLVPCEIIFTNG
jgi:hypothetical protein